MAKASPRKPAGKKTAAPYQHPDAKGLLRSDVGTRAQFKKKKAPKTYRYDSSLSPALDWDAKNPAREQGEQSAKFDHRQVLNAHEHQTYWTLEGSLVDALSIYVAL